MVHVNFVNNSVTAIQYLIVFVGSGSHVLAASYSAKYFTLVVKTAEISGQMASISLFVYNKLLAIKEL